MFVTSGSLRLNTLDPIPLWDLQLARRELGTITTEATVALTNQQTNQNKIKIEHISLRVR